MVNKKMKVLITAGPTYEPIDPVRYIGNRSSGKMGIELAGVYAEWGYTVILVLGPTSLAHTINSDVLCHNVETADEMYEVCMQHLDADIIIGAAAVSDYKVINYSNEKIKKSGNITLELEKNVDILYEIGKLKRSGQILVGFALESNNLIEYAKAKIEKKNLDMIIANYTSSMNSDKSQIMIINGKDLEHPIQYTMNFKYHNARDIRDYIENNFFNI